MKKLLATLLLSTLIVSSAMADFARVELGGGTWINTPTGTLSYTDGAATGLYTSQEKDDSNAYAWLLVKHPLPILPNIRLEYTSLKDDGLATGDFNGFNAPVDSIAALEMTQYDVIPYYNILDNTFWMTVDLGLDFKVTEMTYSAEGVTVPGVGASEAYSDTKAMVIPMVYARARVEIPTTGLALEADGKYVSFEESTIYDARVKVDYTFDITPLIQPGIEIGYRVQKFDISIDGDKSKVDLTFAGLYAGIMLRF